MAENQTTTMTETMLYQEAIEQFNVAPDKAIHTLISLSEKNHIPSLLKLGQYYKQKKAYKEAAKYLYKVYQLEKIKGLRPFFDVYTYYPFTINEMHEFLNYAVDVGLFKAKLHLAHLYLTQPKLNLIKKGESLLLNYYHQTNDIEALIKLYKLYSPNDSTYKHFKEKDIHQAMIYYKEAINQDASLFGADIFDTESIYIDKTIPTVEEFIEMIMFRFKTSLSIDLNFEKDLTFKDLNPKLILHFRPLIDYEAQATLLHDKYEQPDSKNIAINHSTIDKHIQNTQPISDLKSFMEDYKTHLIPLEFKQQVKQDKVEQIIYDQLLKKVPENYTISTMNYDYTMAYLIEPELTLAFNYKNKHYHNQLSLLNLNSVAHLDYPLDVKVEKKMSRMVSSHKKLKRETYLITFTNTILMAILFYQVSIYLMIIPFLYLAFSLYWYHFKPLSNTTFLSHYDSLKMTALKKALRINYLYAFCSLGIFIILFFLLIN